MTALITPGEYPAARVRHTGTGYTGTMTWGPDERATGRFYDVGLNTHDNVTGAAWAARANLARKYDHGDEFADRVRYVSIVGHLGGGEYVVTFIPTYMVNR